MKTAINLEYCKTDAEKFISKIDWKKSSPYPYKVACQNKWMEECCGHMKRPTVHNKKWTKMTCIVDAKPYTNKMEWFKNSQSAYAAAYLNGWLEECTTHMIRPIVWCKKWTEEKCIVDARRFIHIKDWMKESSSSYIAAGRMKILDKCSAHMEKLRQVHTLESCKEESLKYPYISEWDKNSNSTYVSACRNGWMEECTSHMSKIGGTSSSEKFILDMIREFYPTVKKYRDRKVKIEGKPYIKGFDIDMFIPELMKGIEFDGIYFHSFKCMRSQKSKKLWSDDDIRNYHKLKDDWFKTQGIEILHIKEADWFENQQKCIDLCFKFLNIK